MPGLGLPGGIPDLRVAQPLFEEPKAVRLEGLDGIGEEMDGAALAGLGGVAEVRCALHQGDGAADAGLARGFGPVG